MKQSQFKLFVGIDFGTDGSGLAYADKDGNAFVHKPKTSVLFDKDDQVLSVGSKTKAMFLGCKNVAERGWKLFEQVCVCVCVPQSIDVTSLPGKKV